MKQTYQPSTIVKKRKHGFLTRNKTKTGKAVIKRRLLKGRKKI